MGLLVEICRGTCLSPAGTQGQVPRPKVTGCIYLLFVMSIRAGITSVSLIAIIFVKIIVRTSLTRSNYNYCNKKLKAKLHTSRSIRKK
jgi:hypothetical protein